MEILPVNDFATFQRLRKNWDAVYQSDSQAEFFMSWIWLSSWFESKKPGSWLILAIKPEASSSYVGFFPLRLDTTSKNGTPLWYELCMGGNYIADYTGWLCLPEYETQAISAWATYCRQHLTWDLFHLANVLDDRLEIFLNSFATQNFSLSSTSHNPPQNKIDSSCCPYIKLPKTWDEYLTNSLSKGTRQSLKRKLRQFERSPALRITQVTSDNLARQIEIFLDLWQSQWGKQNESMLEFLRRLFHRSWENDSLYLPILWYEDTPVAGIVNFGDRPKKTISFFITGRDLSFNNISSGLLLHAISIRDAIQNGFEIYDLLRGDEAYKFQLGASDRYLSNVTISRPGCFERLQQRLAQGNTVQYDPRHLTHSAIVFSPHQDDETLGCGGTIIQKKRAGANIKIVFMTDGSQSHSQSISPARLKQLRQQEAISAAQKLGVSPQDLIFLEFPDGNLQQYRTAAEQKVREIIARYRPQEIFIPYYLDSVPDHDLTNRIVTSVLVSEPELTIYEYPIWFWSQCPWLTLQDELKDVSYRHIDSQFSRELLSEFCCSIAIKDVIELKRTALNEHKTQVTRFESNPQWTTLGDVLNGKFLECFFQDYEYFRRYTSSALPKINDAPQDRTASASNDLKKALQAARNYQKANSFAQAEQIYRQILQQLPTQPDALYGLSLLAQQTGRDREAEQLLKALVQNQPKSVNGWFTLANLYQQQNKLDDAASCYLRAIQLKPEIFAIHNNLGYVYQQQGQLDRAIASYQQAIAIQPDCIEAKVNIGNVLFAQEKLSPQQQDEYAALNNDLGFDRQRANDLETAIAYYRQAIALQPELTIAHYNLGVTYELQGAWEKARVCYQTIVDRPTKAEPLYRQLSSPRLDKIDRLLQQSKTHSNPAKLRVAFVCQPFVMTDFRNPMDSIGIITNELARRLALDCDLTIYAAAPQTREESCDGVVYRYISVNEDLQAIEQLKQSRPLQTDSIPLFASESYYQQYINTVAQEICDRGFELVHIHNLSQFVPVVRKFNPNAKIILHLHCDWLSHLNYSILCERLQHTDLIISPSQYITNAVRLRFPQYSARCQTVFNGVNLHRFMNGSSNFTQSNKSKKRLLFVGRISPEKGSHVLLEAFKQMIDRYPNLELNLVGPVGVIPSEFLLSLSNDPKLKALEPFHLENAWTNHLKTSLSQLNDHNDTERDRVLLPGSVVPNRLAQYYHQADIFVFPSICYEAFGMPIAEAMVAGLPVVATQAGSFPELIESGKSGLLVERGNSSALAEAILKLLQDENLSQSMGKAGRERAIKLFSFDKVADDLLRWYRSLSSYKC